MFNSYSPKTVFIDDKIEEIQSLLELFAKEGIPYLYYNGKSENLPQEPYKGIRLVISDINLLENEEKDSDKQISKLYEVLSSIISEDSYTFHLVFWTQSEDDAVPDIRKYLESSNIYPLDITIIKKPTDIDIQHMNFNDFEELLESKIPSVDAYNFLTDWENTIQKEVSNFTDSLSSVIKNNDTNITWDESAKKIFSCLANSYLGKDLVPSAHSENLQAVRNYINQSFIHTISNSSYLINDMELPETSQISLSTLAKLNYNLFFNTNFSTEIENGKIFTIESENIENEELKQLIINNIFGDNTIPVDYNPILVGLIITPQCDLAHPRYLHSDTSNYQRVLYGIKLNIDSNFTEYLKKNQITKSTEKAIMENVHLTDKVKKKICKLIKNPFGQDIFQIQPFLDNENKISVIIFHFGTISTEKIEDLNLKIILMLKQDLVFDIQSKLANHVNRLGNSMLEFY